MGWTIPVSCLSGHFFALRNPESWASTQDRGGDIAPEFLGPTYHPTILLTCSANFCMAHLLLCVPVSIYVPSPWIQTDESY